MTTRRPHRWAVFGIAWLAFSLLAACWAVSNPISASPDEPSHFVKAAAVVHGDLIGEATPQGHQVEVPAIVAYTNAATCFAFNAAQTADCQPAPPTDGDAETLTWSAFYNPVYYALVGWPSLLTQDVAALYGMRIVSGVLTGLFAALGLSMLSTWRRAWPTLLTAAAAVTPMTLFLAGSVNPNAPEITGTFAVFVGLLSLVREDVGRWRAERVAVVAVSAVFVASLRAVSPLWPAVALLVAAAFVHGREQWRELASRRSIWIGLGAVVLGVAAALAWTVTATRLDAADGVDDSRVFPGVGTSPLAGIAYVLLRTIDFGVGQIGILGWLDTSLPHAVYLVWALLIGLPVVLAVVLLRGRALWVALAATGTWVLVPALLQGVYVTSGGYIWQGRYGLPLLMIMLVGLGALLSEVLPDRLAPRIIPLVLALWVAGHLYAFATNLRRYAAGAGGAWGDVFDAVGWAPPGGALMWVALYGVGTLAAAAGVWALARATVRSRSPQLAAS